MAGAGVARVTDIAVCTCTAHKSPVSTIGIIIQGSDDSFSDGLSVARVGDIGICDCGHVTIVASGSSVHLTNNKQTARIGDSTTGSPIGTIATGSSKFISG